MTLKNLFPWRKTPITGLHAAGCNSLIICYNSSNMDIWGMLIKKEALNTFSNDTSRMFTKTEAWQMKVAHLTATFTSPLQMKHLDTWTSSTNADCSASFFLALTLPKAMGMCSGGCRLGSKSILYSCLSQRAVSGSLSHGATRSMLETTRQWNCRLDSFLERRETWASRLEEWGCCHAHSNWHTYQKDKVSVKLDSFIQERNSGH